MPADTDKLTAFEAYQIYLALKLHFGKGTYDATRYNFKARAADPEKFRHRPEAHWFNRLSRRYNRQELINALTANFIAGKKYGGMFEGADFEDTYNEWRKRNEALGYHFEQDLKAIRDACYDDGQPEPRLYDALAPVNSGYPRTIKLYLQKKVNLETVVILDRLTKFMSKSDKDISDPLQWPKLRHLVDRYNSLLAPIDRQRYKDIVKTIFN